MVMRKENDYWQKRIKEWTALDPLDRSSEIIFGLIMTLALTGSVRISLVGFADNKQLLWSVLTGNMAWGLVDAMMYLFNTRLMRSHDLNRVSKLIREPNSLASRKILRDNIPPLLSELMTDTDIDALNNKIKKLPPPETSKLFAWKDVVIAVQVFFLVFAGTFPLSLPFIFIDDVHFASKVSNGITLLMLFGLGYFRAKYAGLKPLRAAFGVFLFGLVLVALTMVFGG